MKITTRFAPSPTGYLHIGGLRTALYNYLYARKFGGTFLLRIEDTDLNRNSQDALNAILEAFKWVGLDFDGEIIYQSKRFDIYKSYIDKLLKENKAYYCYMSKEELDILRQNQEKAKIRPHYDGRYRDFDGIPPPGIAPVVRIKAPLNTKISFIDGIKGEINFNTDDIMDDFIIARSDGTPTYNLTVVVDDALMEISDVIRGDDHLSNTPKQIVLYEALGFKIPRFFHLAMIHGDDGKKLSKRHGATDVMEYKNMGILPQALLNFLVRLGWSHGDDEVFSLEELKKYFDPININKSASIYNTKKLEWLNSHYIKNSSFKTIKAHCLKLGFDFEDNEFLFDILKSRSKTLIELINNAKMIINPPKNYEEKALNKFVNQTNIIYLDAFAKELKNQKTTKDFEDFMNDFLLKNNLVLKDLAQPIRLALTGSSVSPGIFEILAFLGIDESKNRIDNFIKFYKSL